MKQRVRQESSASQEEAGLPAESIVMNIKKVDGDRFLDPSLSWMELFEMTLPINANISDPFFKTSKPKNKEGLPSGWSNEGVTTVHGAMANLFGIPKPTEKYHYRFWHKAKGDAIQNGRIGGFMYYSGSLERGMTMKTKAPSGVLIFDEAGKNHTDEMADVPLGANVVTLSSKFEQDSAVAAKMLRVPAGDWRFVPSARKWPRPSIESRIKENLEREGSLDTWLAEKSLPEGGLSKVFGMPVVNYLWLPGGMSGNFAKFKADAARCNAYGAFLVTFEGSHKSWLYCMAWRRRMEEPVYPCNGLMSPQTMRFIADEYVQKSGAISAFPEAKATNSSLMLLLGGSGAGKSTLIKRLAKCSDAQVDKWVLSGLDEFLDWIPEYVESVKDPYVGYTKAADHCYWPEAIGIAQEVNSKTNESNLPLIVEDTGKDLNRTKGFVETLGKGRKVTIAMVDNNPEKAVSRSLGRFQMTGRWSPADYIRESFKSVWDTFLALQAMHTEGHFPVASMSFIYCDNSRNFDSRCWQYNSFDKIWPSSCFERFGMEKLEVDIPKPSKSYENKKPIHSRKEDMDMEDID